VRRSSGRVDHTFVYEREHETLGDGRFRLRLGVAGDRLSDVSHYVYVPEAFKLRFQEMRSDNETIAKVASLAAAALYGIGGCILGTLWLLRRRALLWKRALVAGAVVAGINALALLANAPQAWFSYDTAQPVWVFWGTQIGIAVLVFLVGSLGLALVFMAAEGLSRRAFPDHPQLWRIWSREAAPTPAVLGRTLGGYLFVPIELALIAAFYLAKGGFKPLVLERGDVVGGGAITDFRDRLAFVIAEGKTPEESAACADAAISQLHPRAGAALRGKRHG